MACQVTKRTKTKSEFMNNILDDIFYPEQPICQVIRTSTQKKQNYFKLYRPDPYTCLDYNISQTDTKFDAGDTKIHIQETKATYVPRTDGPPPPPLKKMKYFSGGPPQWEFLDEIWQREEEERQEIYRIEFKKRVAQRKKAEKLHMNFEHNKALEKVGPDWYQELSPKQLATVDDLKSCILKDLSEDTIINTQENIGALGLVPRPNHKCIKKALKNCFKCPVEFLLILYQIIDPERKQYSINDRLLLSAVVHLTMKNTLKELHIRIPSPPPPPKIVKQAPKKKKPVKYDSPYLKPFTFKREPRKFTGIYTDKHIQRPQSPYFSYIDELKEIKQQGTPVKTVDEEIEEELILAQTIYEELVDFRPVPLLLRPSKYYSCNFKNKLNASKNDRAIKKNETSQVDSLEEQVCDAGTEITEELAAVCNYGFENECTMKVKSESEEITFEHDTNLQQDQCQNELNTATTHDTCTQLENCEKEAQTCYNENVEHMSICYTKPTKSENVCPCSNSKNHKKISESKVSYKKEDIMSSATSPEDATEKKHCKHAEELEIYNKMYHVIRPSSDKKPCKCKEKYQQLIETPLCQCEECQEERKKRSICYVISGLTETNSKETISIIDRVVTQKPCECLKKYQTKIKHYEAEREKEAKRPCSCLKETKRLVETPFCQCANCQEDRRMKATKYIIAGLKVTESERLRIIEGISTGRPCQCITNYEKRIEEYESFRKRKELVMNLKGQEYKFAISGIVNTAEGPVYVISGMRPPIDCICAKKAREEIADKHMQSIMPHIPPGRIKYGIAGVRETPQGNVYIIDSTIPIEDCECMNLYEIFVKQHSSCNKLYDEYLTNMKEEYDAFLIEMSQQPNNATTGEVEDVETEDAEKDYNMPTQLEIEEQLISDKQSAKDTDDVAFDEYEQKTEICEKTPVTCLSCNPISDNKNYYVCCNCGNFYLTSCTCGEIPECVHCLCGGQLIECVDCTCGIEEEIEEEEEKSLKRFFIFKKIICRHKWQMTVVKRALESMAEDGYPLAKLPECYKLPHFKLWMQMRCRMFWTKKDRYDYILKSKNMWRHLGACNMYRLCRPELTISKSKAKLIDWSQADYCRKLVSECLERFYKRVKQNRIHSGREWFPSSFPYEFPGKTWRDCYFAYIPTKEEEVQGRFVWQKFEFKNFAEMQRFCS